VFLTATYVLNGGASGRDYLVRYFSISAVVTLWIAIPFQIAISLPTVVPSLAAIDWYVAAIVSTTNILYFSFVAWQIHGIAMRSRMSVV